MVAPGACAWDLDDVLDALFFAVAAAATCWFAVLLVAGGLHLDWGTGLRLLLFWAVLAYLALPRLHQVLTWLYVPDYFIGRTRTGDGLLGDPVNLGAWGSEEALHTAMTSAGWVRSDPVTLRSSARLIGAWARRRPYPPAPVSTLTLFGRRQDVAYVKEVDGNPSQRHHVRFWRVPEGWLLPGGASVDWLAAGSYDRAVGLSSLTFQVTHKIDTDIDLERNYIVDDVRWAVPTAGLEVWPRFFTSYHSTNGGGDKVSTDGALCVLDLRDVDPGDGEDARAARGRDDAARHHTRPGDLIKAMLLLVALVVIDAVRWTAVDLPELLAGEPGEVRAAVAGLSVLLVLAVALLAAAAWRGHPRSRVVLMGVLAIGALADLAQVTAVGVDSAGGLLLTTALQVLALLALTSRDVHQWEHARKGSRVRARRG
nr:LssY C-terminal domain-containing protein [Actinomyces radicidentis]